MVTACGLAVATSLPALRLGAGRVLHLGTSVAHQLINSEKMSKGIVCIPGIPLHLRRKTWAFPTFFVAGIKRYESFSPQKKKLQVEMMGCSQNEVSTDTLLP